MLIINKIKIQIKKIKLITQMIKYLSFFVLLSPSWFLPPYRIHWSFLGGESCIMQGDIQGCHYHQSLCIYMYYVQDTSSCFLLSCNIFNINCWCMLFSLPFPLSTLISIVTRFFNKYSILSFKCPFDIEMGLIFHLYFSSS